MTRSTMVLFLGYDRASTNLAEEPETEEQPIEAVAQPEAKPKHSRRKQAV